MAKFKKRLTLSNREYEKLLRSMELKSNAGPHSTTRNHKRHPFYITDLPMSIEHPDGGRSLFLVHGRNLSSGGMSVLHGGYVHIGSECKVILRTVDHEPQAISGIVRYCYLIQGSCHELGIQFNEEIDPAQFVSLSTETAIDQPALLIQSAEVPSPIDGCVLLVENFEPDRLLIEHQLKELAFPTIAVPTATAAMDHIQDEKLTIRIVLSGLDLHHEGGANMIQAMRDTGYEESIVVMSADPNASFITAAGDAGADDIMTKPFTLDLLTSTLKANRREIALQWRSSLEHDPDMKPLIARYLVHVRQIASQINGEIKSGDHKKVRELCCRLKGSGHTYGFHQLTLCALRAIASIDVDPYSGESRVTLDHLLEYCRRLNSATQKAA